MAGRGRGLKTRMSSGSARLSPVGTPTAGRGKMSASLRTNLRASSKFAKMSPGGSNRGTPGLKRAATGGPSLRLNTNLKGAGPGVPPVRPGPADGAAPVVAVPTGGPSRGGTGPSPLAGGSMRLASPGAASSLVPPSPMSKRQHMLASIGKTGSMGGSGSLKAEQELKALTMKQREDIRKWRDSCAQEAAAMSFSSPVLEYEFMLRRAQSFGVGARPRNIAVSVALEAMDAMAAAKGNAYASVLTILRDMVVEAVYMPADAEAARSQVETAEDKLAVYMKCMPYSSRVKEVETDVEDLEAEKAKLLRKMEEITKSTDHRYEDELQKRLDMEQQVANAELHLKKMSQDVKKAQDALAEYEGFDALSMIVKLFDDLSDTEKRTTLSDMIEALPLFIPELTRKLMAQLNINMLTSMVFEITTGHRDFNPNHVDELVTKYVDCKVLEQTDGYRGYLLAKLIENAQRDRLKVIRSGLALVTPEEQRFFMRHMVGFEASSPFEEPAAPSAKKDGASAERKEAAPVDVTEQDLRDEAGAESIFEKAMLAKVLVQGFPEAQLTEHVARILDHNFSAFARGSSGPTFGALSAEDRMDMISRLVAHLSEDEKKEFASIEFADYFKEDEPEPEPEPEEKEEEEVEVKPPEKKKFLSPFAKYMRKPDKGVKTQKMKLPVVVLLTYDIYEKKLAADALEFADGGAPDALPSFVRDFLIQKYGLPSICEGYLYGMMGMVMKSTSNERLRLFGEMCGIVRPECYDPRLCNIVLKVYSIAFPKFSAVVLRSRKVGYCITPIALAMQAIDAVFVEKPVAFKLDCLRLSNGRKATLTKAIEASAMPYKDKVPESDWEDSWSKDAIVVDVDKAMRLIVDTFFEQQADDRVRLEVMYHEYDDDGNGVLTFDEFTNIVNAMAKDVRPKKLMQLFKDVSAMDDELDSVSPQAFGFLCMTRGLSAPIK